MIQSNDDASQGRQYASPPLPPRVYRVGAHEVLPGGAELVALVEGVAEERRELGPALHLRSHDERPLVRMVGVVPVDCVAEPVVGVREGGAGREGVERFPGEDDVAQSPVARVGQARPPPVRSRGRGGGYPRSGHVAAVAQPVHVARPVLLVGGHARRALDVGRCLGVVRVREALMAGGRARRFGGGARELGGDVGEFPIGGGGGGGVGIPLPGGGRVDERR